MTVVSSRSYPPSSQSPPPRPPRDFSQIWKVLIVISLLMAVAALVASATAIREDDIRQIAAEEAGAQMQSAAAPSAAPFTTKTSGPVATPTELPTHTPTVEVTPTPTVRPTLAVPASPTHMPTVEVTPTPTVRPTLAVPASPTSLVQWAEGSIVRVQADESGGSGLIFDTEGDTAFVVTNYHVIEDSDAYDVVVRNSTRYKATLLGYDEEKDIAVLSICCDPTFVPIPWDSGATAQMGEEVVAVGYPRGSGSRVTATIGSMQDDWLGNTLGLASHSAPLNPGNSGGPLFSMDGRVLGVNVGRSNLEEGIFYAVPYEVSRDDVLAWRAKLVVLPTPTPAVLEYADMWVKLQQDERGRLVAQVDVAFDVGRFDLSVFIEGKDMCNPDPMYADEGYYFLSCVAPEVNHAAVTNVSAQVDSSRNVRGMRCQRSHHSNVDRTLFACSWR